MVEGGRWRRFAGWVRAAANLAFLTKLKEAEVILPAQMINRSTLAASPLSPRLPGDEATGDRSIIRASGIGVQFWTDRLVTLGRVSSRAGCVASQVRKVAGARE